MNDKEIVALAALKFVKNNTIIDSINNYGITNLNKYNYISVVDILNWNRIVIDRIVIQNHSHRFTRSHPLTTSATRVKIP